MSHYLGIDVSKDKLDVALLHGEHLTTGDFSNSPIGWTKLGRWLEKRQVSQLHACLEATGRYGQGAALFLHQQGYQVSVVNPRRTKAYADSKLSRNKTDAIDAKLIADFCVTQKPGLWSPASAAQQELQALTRHLDALKEDRQRERNRLKAGLQLQTVIAAIEAHLAFLDRQIADLEQQIQQVIHQDPNLKRKRDLLTSIPAIGDTTAAVFLAEVPDVTDFPQASQLAAYAGVTPRQHHSGSSVRRRTRMAKTGNRRLRTAFFMPALAAYRYNPIIQALVTRLQQRGKSKMTIVGAAMRKLLHLAYGVLKTGQPF
ncbi:MAG: IS110 family transposase, partial [Anaerolineales bacterium]